MGIKRVSYHILFYHVLIFQPSYFNGKLRAEAAVKELYPEKGTILHPGFIYGPRTVVGYTLPLQLIGRYPSYNLSYAVFIKTCVQ